MKKANNLINDILLFIGVAMIIVGCVTLYAVNENLLKGIVFISAAMLIAKIQLVNKQSKRKKVRYHEKVLSQ